MQGKKECHPKMMYQVSLDDLVPGSNYYRLINRKLDLKFLYESTEKYYRAEGQESIEEFTEVVTNCDHLQNMKFQNVISSLQHNGRRFMRINQRKNEEKSKITICDL